uniref:PQ-loop domain-containing transporter n=1 Tax=Bacillus pumilus TaxID=1408 RepID=UPI0021B3A204
IIEGTSVEVVVTQALNAIGAWYTLGLVIYCRKLNNSTIKVNKGIMLVAVLIVLFMALYCVTHTLTQSGYAFQTVGTIALLTAYVPQIWHLNKVKDATGVSRWLFVVLGLGLLCVTGNMIITKTDATIIITEFVNIALIFVQYCMTVYYQRKK